MTPPVIQTRVERLIPPATLNKVCIAPLYYGKTYGDLVDYTFSLLQTIKQCGARDTIRNDWFEGTNKKS